MHLPTPKIEGAKISPVSDGITDVSVIAQEYCLRLRR